METSPLPKSYSRSISITPAWTSPSTPSDFSDPQSSTPNSGLLSYIQPSRSPSFEGNRCFEPYSTHPRPVHDAGSESPLNSNPGNGPSIRSSREAKIKSGRLGIGSSKRPLVHESMWADPFPPQMDSVHGTVGGLHGLVDICPTNYGNTCAGAEANKIENTGGSRRQTSDGSVSGDSDAGLPHQTAGSRRSSSQSEPAMDDELIICKLGCRNKRGFRDKQTFEVHLRNVHSHKGFLCPKDSCTQAFRHKTDLKRHQQSIHESAKPFRCERPHCPAPKAKSFSRLDKLKEHDRKYHRNFKCWFCFRWFEYEQDYWGHTNREHSGQDPRGEQYSSYPSLAPVYPTSGYRS